MLLRRGASFERVVDRKLRYARGLVDDGVRFRDERGVDDPDVLALIRSEVLGSAGFAPTDDMATIIAESREATVIGALHPAVPAGGGRGLPPVRSYGTS